MSTWTHHRARVASLSRDRAADDPELIEAKRDLRAARLAADLDALAEQARAAAESDPPLTREQADRIRSAAASVAIVLRPAAGRRAS